MAPAIQHVGDLSLSVVRPWNGDRSVAHLDAGQQMWQQMWRGAGARSVCGMRESAVGSATAENCAERVTGCVQTCVHSF